MSVIVIIFENNEIKYHFHHKKVWTDCSGHNYRTVWLIDLLNEITLLK